MIRSIFCLLLLLSACTLKTEKGFKQWMDLQVNKPISDVYKKGFHPVNTYKDELEKRTYLTFTEASGTETKVSGYVNRYGNYSGTSQSSLLNCNIIWIVDEDGKRVSYDHNGNNCKEFEVEYLLRNGSKQDFSSVVTAPAFDYVGSKLYSYMSSNKGQNSNNSNESSSKISDNNSHNANKGINNKQFIHKTVNILPFKNEVTEKNDNKTMLGFIPFMPYGWQSLEKVDMPLEKSLGSELMSFNVFRNIVYSENKSDTDYYIQGHLLSSHWEQKMLTYCLSVYGSIFWFLGAPSFIITNDLSIRLELVDNKTKKQVMSKIYTAPKYTHLEWFYTIWFMNSEDMFNYDNMLREVYGKFVEDLSRL